MGGLARIAKIYGGMTIQLEGKSVEWVYDYFQDKPRLKSEMSKEEFAKSEKFRFDKLKEEFEKRKNSQGTLF